MPVVQTSTWINAPVAKVYAIAKECEQYPEYMKAVQSLTVTERGDNWVRADWVGLITQFNMKVRWTQEDTWDDANTRSAFRQIKGDYDKMEGEWIFKEENGGTRFEQVLDYEYNVPTLGALVKKIVQHLVTSQLEAAAEAIKIRAESAAA
jgi:ribosome-associated toxin RatA of RatAB toxin-antitoxin module